MGFFSNLIGKAKGVFGRVVGGIKTALPAVAGVLGTSYIGAIKTLAYTAVLFVFAVVIFHRQSKK